MSCLASLLFVLLGLLVFPRTSESFLSSLDITCVSDNSPEVV